MYDEKHRNYDSKSGINDFFWLNHLIGEKSPLNYGLIGKSAFLPGLVDPKKWQFGAPPGPRYRATV